MGWLLGRALLYIAIALVGAALGTIVGDLAGGPQLGTAIGAAVAIGCGVLMDELRAHRLMEWLRGDLEREAPRAHGFWGEAAYRVERALRQREQALIQEQQRYAQFMS